MRYMPVLSEHYTDSSFMPFFPELLLESGTELADVFQALETLPEKDRLILSLVFVDDLTLAEVALVLDMQAGEAFMLYQRASQRLKTSLGQHVPHPLIV